MKSFNLTEWALKHQQLVWFFIIVTSLMGVLSYRNLGRMEDPDFVIRQMVVAVGWPGARALQVEEQVTDKIEKKLQNTPGLDYLRSYSRPGQSVIYVNLKETTPEKDIRPTWVEVRNMVNDMKDTLPAGVIGPYFNDRFDDVFGCLYALTSDGFSYEEMREQAERIRRILLGVPSVKKVDLLGVQPEKIYIEMETSKLAQLGIDPNLLISTLQTQNTMMPSGMIATESDNVYLRISGMFEDLDSIRNLAMGTFRLGDIASVERGYIDPPEPKMYFNGQPAVGIALSMEKGGNILTLGDNLQQTLTRIQKELPLGLEINQIANQPEVVKESIDEFIKTLGEAVVIVLAVSFFSLGVRTGTVVALCIPLVIAGVFASMEMAGIPLHKVSLGALIIALGLLVDDAIIAVEMMAVKLEQGWDRFRAACHAYTVTAFPMLTGTLITCAGFIPIGFAKGNAAEFTRSLFLVVTIALLISWIVSVAVTPLFGYYLIKMKPSDSGHHHDIYNTKFYRVFKRILIWCLTYRKIVLTATLLSFIGSVVLLGFVKQEFFPPSVRPELIVEMRLPEGASFQSTAAEAQKLAAALKDDPNIANYTYYVGQGAPRFVLTFDPVLPSSNYAQFVIVAKDLQARIALYDKVNALFAKQFENVRGHLKVIQTGPPAAYPVMFRVTGYDHGKVRDIANQVYDVMAATPYLRNINLDWNEKNKVMHLEIDQDKARMMGIDSRRLAFSLQAELSGIPIAEFREKDKTVSIVCRIDSQNRMDLGQIKDLNIHLGGGKFVPLDQIAQITYEAEEGLIWRRDLKPTITVQAEVAPGITGEDASKQLDAKLQSLRATLPPDYEITVGGSAEGSAQATGFLIQPVPVMLVIIIMLLMFQLQSISRTLLTLLTAPLGIIGVSAALLLTQRAMGFVAELGVLALAGIIIRNSVILIDQIEQQIEAGETKWQAIINAAVLRFRPIMLTAAAAILGMIPLVPSIFFGPMAVAIAGGLFAATILTLLVLPVMYAAWFRVKSDAV